MRDTTLRRAQDFARVKASGQRARSDGIVVTAAPAADRAAQSRMGLAIGRATGGAAVRNRVKRRLRAAWGNLEIPPGYEFIVGASAELSRVDYQKLVEHLQTAVTRAIAPETAG